MKKDAQEFLRTLLNTPSPSGSEQAAAALVRQRLHDGGITNMQTDLLGNTIATINPNARFNLILTGHIDEVGLMITHIDDDGFLYVAQIGGFDSSLLVGQRVQILNARGVVTGVIGRKPIHLMDKADRDKPVKMDKIWLDIGAANKKQALKKVAVGDSLVIDASYQLLQGNRFTARGCDNRVGVFVVTEVLRNLAKRKIKIAVTGLAAAQEEIGSRGAAAAVYNIQPDAAIVFEVGHTTDYPGMNPKKDQDIKMDAGPIIHKGPNMNPPLTADILHAAEQLKIPHQIRAEARITPTDARAIQISRGGIPCALIRIPNRYMHSPVELMSLRDIDLTIKLVTEFLANFHYNEQSTMNNVRQAKHNDKY